VVNYYQVIGPALYYTLGDIDSAEITKVLDKGQAVLGKLALEAGYSSLYSMRDCKQCERMLLYLKLYAIESWDNTDNALNFFTVDQMKELLNSVEQLFGLCN